jgi:excisionase family DNA binding protein
MEQLQPEELLTSAEVARLFRVDPRTVRKWALDGKLGVRKTLGGHRRYFASEIMAALGHESDPDVP